ncbi:MAG: hypothetical protein LCH63_07080 [Candidatus Melainabacteria bacterium]|uniref:Uncharacterized protein n=1 Tax=Candidatus Obscuribacter phosphatis TaxID=1906157 RepID=A0A8J7TK19_9BACT|nr:hypothetical protein [Candidatus Obscuribacter phosphatis]MCA0313590.1 hypothetical protein [Candidatus Melainabacteria bacterium]
MTATKMNKFPFYTNLAGLLLALTVGTEVSAQPVFNLNNSQPTNQALAAPPLSFVDVNSGRFGKLEISMDDGQFLSGSTDNLHLIARDMDFAQGELKSLDLELKGAHLRDFIVDKLTLSTQGTLSFDSGLLLNQKMLQFRSPAEAQVTALISQESLNKFLKAPTTLNRLSVTAGQPGSILSKLLGLAQGAPNQNGQPGQPGQAGQFGLTMETANISLLKANKINIQAVGKLGLSQLAIPLNAEVESRLFLENGWVQVGDTKLMTAGQEISPQLSQMLVEKINNLSNLGQKSDDIHFSFTDLKVVPGKQLMVTGTAMVNRLRFGRQG